MKRLTWKELGLQPVLHVLDIIHSLFIYMFISLKKKLSVLCNKFISDSFLSIINDILNLHKNKYICISQIFFFFFGYKDLIFIQFREDLRYRSNIVSQVFLLLVMVLIVGKKLTIDGLVLYSNQSCEGLIEEGKHFVY